MSVVRDLRRLLREKEREREEEKLEEIRERSAIEEIVHCFVKSTFIYICDNGQG